MGVFRRPELEKDNPIAPQMYVGPRRRLALLREAAKSQVSVPGGMAETLQTLTEASEGFLANEPPSKKGNRERSALLEAITRAQQLLSGEQLPRKRKTKKGGSLSSS